jgi:hypothetical protein
MVNELQDQDYANLIIIFSPFLAPQSARRVQHNVERKMQFLWEWRFHMSVTEDR